MILLLDTSTPVCITHWISENNRDTGKWEANRDLADNLISYLRGQLEARGSSWRDIKGIGLYRGPGSFTGLRIGHTVMNTVASDLSIPIVGVVGENWIEVAIERLQNNETDDLVMPLYGREANITTPRK